MKLLHYLLASVSLFAFTACSESNDDEWDSDGWKAENESFFEQQYQSHSTTSETRFILPNWSQPSSKTVSELAHTDCILVDVIEKGSGTPSPYYTDSVAIHYSGRLIATDDTPGGYEFDRSYLTSLDEAVDVPYEVGVNSVVNGFSTALQHMHRGDVWRVIVPYQLGYGTSDHDVIPAYSTLIFEIHLVDFWKDEEGDRND